MCLTNVCFSEITLALCSTIVEKQRITTLDLGTFFKACFVTVVFKMVVCYYCGHEFDTVNGLHNHLIEGDLPSNFAPFYPAHTFLSRDGQWRANEYTRIFGSHDFSCEIDHVLTDARVTTHHLLRHHGFHNRFNIQIYAEMAKESPDELTFVHQYLTSKCKIPYNDNEFHNMYSNACQEIRNQLETFCQEGSGWTLIQVLAINITISKFRPQHYGCNGELPAELEKRKCILNIEDDQHRCFMLSVLAGCFPLSDKRNQNRASKYLQHQHKFVWPSNFPVTLHNVEKFCNKNPVAISIIEYDEMLKTFFPIRFERIRKENTVVLLAIKEPFYLVKNVNALLQTRKYRPHGKQ